MSIVSRSALSGAVLLLMVAAAPAAKASTVLTADNSSVVFSQTVAKGVPTQTDYYTFTVSSGTALTDISVTASANIKNYTYTLYKSAPAAPW